MSPRWRWWLFCAALWTFTRWGVGGAVMSWAVLPEWLGHGAKCGEGTPW